jgi:hypothetical protein
MAISTHNIIFDFLFRYIPSNFARREKRSLLDKIISKRINKKSALTNGYLNERILSLALVKFRYDAERYLQIFYSNFFLFFRFCSEDEISLNKGIWVNVLQKKNDGWWLVQYEKQRGWFPSNYLIEVRDFFFANKIKSFVCFFFIEN